MILSGESCWLFPFEVNRSPKALPLAVSFTVPKHHPKVELVFCVVLLFFKNEVSFPTLSLLQVLCRIVKDPRSDAVEMCS